MSANRPPRLQRVSKETVLAGAVVAITFIVTYVSTVTWEPLFAPDSRYYAAMALWFSGDSQAEAARQVAELSAQSGWAAPPDSQLFGWGLVQPRVVLPALSVPFVKLWGIDGLAVIPGVALACLMAVLAWMLFRRYGLAAATSSLVLIMCSSRIMFYGSAMLTESLSALWGALTLIAAWRYAQRPSWRPVAWMVPRWIAWRFNDREPGLDQVQPAPRRSGESTRMRGFLASHSATSAFLCAA